MVVTIEVAQLRDYVTREIAAIRLELRELRGRSDQTDELRREIVEYVGLAHEAVELASRADVVVNAAPLTALTRGMFDRQFFLAMKPGAYFVNIGRGESVVTADLVQALESGRVAGAALDVTDPEPLPPGHPLWGMNNVVLTPHTGGASDRVKRRLLVLAAENLRRYASGDRMLSVVDPRRGY